MLGLNFYILSHFFTGLISLVLGLLVYQRGKENKTNISFSLLALCVAAWSFLYSIWLLSDNAQAGLFFARALNLAATFIPVLYLHWVTNILARDSKQTLAFFYVLTFIFALFSFTPLYINGTYPVFNFPYWPLAGPVYAFFIVCVWISLIIYSSILLFKQLKQSRAYHRSQIILVLIGSLIGFLGGSTNYLLMFRIDIWQPIGSPLVAAFPIIFAYAMVRHRLMDVKFVMRKYTVAFLSLLLVLMPTLTVKYYFNRFLLVQSLLVDVCLLFLSVWLYPPVKLFVGRFANRYFFFSLYDKKQVIAQVVERLRETININQVYDIIYRSLDKAMHVKSFGILRYDEKRQQFLTQFNIDFNIGRRVVFGRHDVLTNYFEAGNRYLIISLARAFEKDSRIKEALDLLHEMKIEAMFPLVIKERIAGLMVLGPKESGDMYNEDDLQVLGIVASQSAMAIENAMLFGQTKDFALRMEEEVKKATAELRAANEHLKKLDEAKSEFISIASHQLRTPLTVIKGYISMMLEGSFGPIAEPIQDPMAKVYESNERLISLVENLLNVSRIESGHLKFSFEPLSLSALVRSVGEELGPKASEKGLQLDLRLPKKEVSLIRADAEKIRQAVMNLIDNAIKYTSKGKITVTLRQMKDEISFSVKDKGLGIKPDDIPNLFHKFARGSGAMLEHTEGTGLGLYVAKEMIEAHGGRISAESAGEGKGSTFGFVLPIGKEGVPMGEETLLRDLRPALAIS